MNASPKNIALTVGFFAASVVSFYAMSILITMTEVVKVPVLDSDTGKYVIKYEERQKDLGLTLLSVACGLGFLVASLFSLTERIYLGD